MSSDKEKASEFDRYNGRTKEVLLRTERDGEEVDLTIKVKTLKTKHFFRLLGIFKKIQDKLGFSQKDLEEIKLDAKLIRNVVSKGMEAVIGDVDLSNPEEMGATATVVFSELGFIFNVKAEDLANSDFEDLVELLVAFWEVNASGPLGLRIRAITEKLRPQLELLKDAADLTFQTALMMALPRGGTTDGGTTGSSTPSRSTDTPSTTSSSSTSYESSTSSPASATTESSSELPSTDPRTAESPPTTATTGHSATSEA